MPSLRATTISLTEGQRQRLAKLVASSLEAQKLFQKFQREADTRLDYEGQPVAHLGTAARLETDPLKQQSRASLQDMKVLEALGYSFAVTGHKSYCAAAKRIILRWASVNQPNGVPIDETKLEPLLFAYDLTRGAFSAVERSSVDDWLHVMAGLEMRSGETNSVTAMNNWNSHRLKIVGLIGFALSDKNLVDWAVNGFKKQIELNLSPDGSSFDFHQRDALHYHCYDLEPLLSLAMAAHQNGIELYHYEAPNRASLPKAVDFLVPYCTGARKHAEWVHSKVKFDRERAEAGEKGFVVGAPFDPQEARHVLELAAFFDSRYLGVLAQITRHGAQYPTWQVVLNKVRTMK